jgi:pimeloyl-ACP methyl ester carboxylesterase
MLTPKTVQVSLPNPDGVGTHNVIYYAWGNPAGRTVVCVHGLTRNGRDFDVLANALAEKGYYVICPDVAGRGKSEHFPIASWYNNPVYAKDLLYLLTSIGRLNVDWIGTSMGGLIALLVANFAPGVIGKLILNDIGCVVSSDALKRIGTYVSASNKFESYALAEDALRARTASYAIPEQYWQEFASHSIDRKENGGAQLAYDPAISGAMPPENEIKDIEMWPLWEAVKAIPTLLIHGRHSDILSGATVKQMKATHPMFSYFEVTNAGHAPALMSDAEIDKILAFLGQ